MKQQYKTDKIVVICNGLGDLISANVAFEHFHTLYKSDLYLITWPGIFYESQLYNPNFKAVFGIGGQPQDQYQWAIQNGFLQQEIVVLDNIVHYARNCGKCGNFDIDWWWKTLYSFNLTLTEGYCLNLIGEIPSNLRPKFYITENDNNYYKQLQDFRPYIVINHTTGTNRSNKEWPLSNWHSLINLILDKYPFNIITVGQQNDVIIPIENNHKNRIKHLRDTSIRELYPILCNAAFHILSQSGIAWMSECTDVPSIQLNIGGPSSIVGNKSPHCIVVDQLGVFNPDSVTINMVWNAIQEKFS